MAQSSGFKNAFDSFMDRRNQEYAKEVNFADALQKARMNVAQEERARAGLNVTSQIAQSQEQRALDNQSYTNFMNQLSAPLRSRQAWLADYLLTEQEKNFPLVAATNTNNLLSNLHNSAMREAYGREDWDAFEKITARKIRRDLADGQLYEVFPNGRKIPIGKNLDLEEMGRKLEMKVMSDYFNGNPTPSTGNAGGATFQSLTGGSPGTTPDNLDRKNGYGKSSPNTILSTINMSGQDQYTSNPMLSGINFEPNAAKNGTFAINPEKSRDQKIQDIQRQIDELNGKAGVLSYLENAKLEKLQKELERIMQK